MGIGFMIDSSSDIESNRWQGDVGDVAASAQLYSTLLISLLDFITYCQIFLSGSLIQ